MESVVADISLAIVAFASTNIDDIFVLVTFFSDTSFSARDVVIGQYIGVGTLYTVSAIAALISLIIPPASVGLLGLAPIAIGTRKLVSLMRGQKKEESRNVSTCGTRIRRLAVAAVTMANGGDNIAVYTALFASRGGSALPTIGIVFAIMTGLWCFAAHWLINHRALGSPIRQKAHRLVPFLLIGLGVLIIIRTGALQLWK
jgi:cadmium resistance protein CadD (predicted permease)